MCVYTIYIYVSFIYIIIIIIMCYSIFSSFFSVEKIGHCTEWINTPKMNLRREKVLFSWKILTRKINVKQKMIEIYQNATWELIAAQIFHQYLPAGGSESTQLVRVYLKKTMGFVCVEWVVYVFVCMCASYKYKILWARMEWREAATPPASTCFPLVNWMRWYSD